jgi:hypothetical protein
MPSYVFLAALLLSVGSNYPPVGMVTIGAENSWGRADQTVAYSVVLQRHCRGWAHIDVDLGGFLLGSASSYVVHSLPDLYNVGYDNHSRTRFCLSMRLPSCSLRST